MPGGRRNDVAATPRPRRHVVGGWPQSGRFDASTILCSALTNAVTEELIPKNIASLLHVSKQRMRKVKPWTAEEARPGTVWSSVACGCLCPAFGEPLADVLTHRVQLVCKRCECTQARFRTEGRAGLIQRVEPFLNNLPGCVPVRQQEGGWPCDVEGDASRAAGAGWAYRQGGQNCAQLAHYPVHQVFRGPRQGVQFGRGLAVVNVVPAQYLEHDLVQAIGEVRDPRGEDVLDQSSRADIRGQPDEGWLDRPGRIECRIG